MFKGNTYGRNLSQNMILNQLEISLSPKMSCPLICCSYQKNLRATSQAITAPKEWPVEHHGNFSKDMTAHLVAKCTTQQLGRQYICGWDARKWLVRICVMLIISWYSCVAELLHGLQDFTLWLYWFPCSELCHHLFESSVYFSRFHPLCRILAKTSDAC